MTIAAAFWPRRHARLSSAIDRLFEVEPGTRILAKCHWQLHPADAPTIVVVHGLEGSAESGYMQGIAECGFAAGFNVVRLNQRNCGGTDALTPSLYNSGRSGDFRAILGELIERDGFQEIFFAGYSMGGNLVLKMAGELGGDAPPQLCGVCGVCPTLELAQCVDACDTSRNPLYRWHFVSSLKGRMRRKARLFPGLYNLDGLGKVRTLREFDGLITAPNCGYRDAGDYYHRASCMRVAAQIRVPTLLITAKDDPVVPFDPFLDPLVVGNPNIRVVAPDHGGHCSFISADAAERHWAEPRVVEFFQELFERKTTNPLASQATG
jgi:hypothetical protein